LFASDADQLWPEGLCPIRDRHALLSHNRDVAAAIAILVSGVVWAEAAPRDALEGCVLALEVGNLLLQVLEEELLAQAPGCGCACAGGPAKPGTSAARRGGRRRVPPPHDTADAAAGAGAG